MFVWFIAALTALVSITASTPAAAQEDAGDAATELATRYAPVFRLKAQDGPCDEDGEPYSPIPVDAVLDNPQVLLRQWGNDDPVIMRGPSAADLSDLGEGFYLDFPGSTLSPGCIYETDNARFNRDLEPSVYARVFEGVGDDSDQVIVQYWTYWCFNDWNNKHESDWEGIALRFDAGPVGPLNGPLCRSPQRPS